MIFPADTVREEACSGPISPRRVGLYVCAQALRGEPILTSSPPRPLGALQTRPGDACPHDETARLNRPTCAFQELLPGRPRLCSPECAGRLSLTGAVGLAIYSTTVYHITNAMHAHYTDTQITELCAVQPRQVHAEGTAIINTGDASPASASPVDRPCQLARLRRAGPCATLPPL